MKKIMVGLLFILGFLIVGCEKKEEVKEETKVEIRELTKQEQNSLIRRITELEYLDFYNKNFIPSDLTNQEVLRVSYEIYKLNNKGVDPFNVSFSDLEVIAKEYLGFSLEPENITCDTHFYVSHESSDLLLYDIDTGKYVYNDSHLGHGSGGIRSKVINFYVSGKVEGDRATIVVHKLFSEILGDVYEGKLGYYSSYSNAKEYKSVLFKAMYNDDLKDEYDKLDKSKLVSFTYVFDIVDGKYVLSEYKLGE